MVAQTRHSGTNASSSKKRLAFHEKLAGKGVTTDALLKKLKTLHQQLAALDQDTVETNSLATVRTELILTSLLLHKDRGVKAYTACCLADILRLYAPEAPYTQHELRDIFQFFFRQLSAGFKGADEPYYTEYFHLVESLSTVKSVVLVCDLPSADELLLEIFQNFFSIVKRDLARKVELYMADILVALIEECTSLPSDVLDILMAQFTDKNAKVDQSGYRLAVAVCNGAADKLQRHVCQHFGDILTNTSHPSGDDSDDEPQPDKDTLLKSHELVKRLFRSCPAVLHSVIPILETELRSDALEPRIMATQTLGEMYADKGGVDLVRKYPSTWTTWINRKVDVAVGVRLKCVEATPALITNLPECREALAELLKIKLLDPDEKIRAAVCKVYSQMDYETALHHVSEEQIRAVANRGLDKKAAVRYQALNSVGKLYNLAYPEIENNDAAAITKFAWIPDEIIQTANTSTEIRTLVEQFLADHVLPLPNTSTNTATKEREIDEVAWTDRLLSVMRFLSERSVQVLINLSGLKTNRPNVCDIYLESCIKNNGGIIDGDEENVTKKLKLSIHHLASTYSDPVKAAEDLNTFAKANENRLYKLLKTCMDPQTDLKSLTKAMNEFTKRVSQLPTPISPTLATLLRRSTFWIISASSLPTLLKRLQKVSGPRPSEANPTPNTKSHHAANNALTLLTAIGKWAPMLFRSHISELGRIINTGSTDQSPSKKTPTQPGALSIEIALMGLANAVRSDPSLSSTIDKKTNARIAKYALGDDWRQAKFATRYLAFAKGSKVYCAQVVESIANTIEEESELPMEHISALTQVARFAPDAFEQKSDVIVTHLVKKVLMVPILSENSEDDEEEWYEDPSQIPDLLRARILSIKVLRNRCMAHASSEQALQIAAPVLKLLPSLIEHEGNIDGRVDEDPKAKSRMRLQAAISLLHLSTVESFAQAISPKFVRLACVIQDSCFNVRLAFLAKIIALLQPRKLPARFNVIPFLTILDPEADTKNNAASYITNVKRQLPAALRVDNLEIIFIRLLHLLAHHPDFNTTQDELMDLASYLQFYLDLIATSENISLLYHLSNKGKTVRDAESHGHSENFYIMCELAQTLIKARAQQHSWTLPSYPGKVRLPSDILRPLPNAEATNQILKTVYLPEEANVWLSEKFKLGSSKEKKEKEKKERVPAKRKAPTTKNNGHSKRPRKRKDEDDDDDEEADEQDESDVEMEDVDRPSKSRRTNGKSKNSDDVEENGVPRRVSRAERLSARTLAKEKLDKNASDEEDEE
ncbi:cohesin-associated protein Pds5 [Crepidotus variabilis]|uniref:Cohesin-associated protein Pds5 n=1 Tax=Crepidotus variabilis TaxID=179855 RepID=A0A9P6EEC6_9AGAR|nr:cohesin-associated protein Pds5 [Crepidotus variabilis]